MLRWSSSRFQAIIHGQTVVLQHRSMVFAALSSAWSRGPHSEDRVAFAAHWQQGHRATGRSARCRIDGHDLMGVAIVARGGAPHWRASKQGGNARKPLVRMAYQEGRMARLCPVRGPIGIDRNQRVADLALSSSEIERRWWALSDCAHQITVDTLILSH
jgi:hypothetical protein